MTAEEFIRKNPFPENGSELNLSLVMDIQNPDLVEFKDRNIEKLFRVNARLIWLVYEQNNYGESLDSVMSFMYEGIRRASELYNPAYGMPFYNYAMKITRALLQNYHNYHGSVIHVPVRKKGDEVYKFSYADIDDYMDFETGAASQLIEPEDGIETTSGLEELYEVAEKYSLRSDITTETRFGLTLLTSMRGKRFDEICEQYDISETKLKKYLNQIVSRLKTYRDYGK